MKTCSTCSCKMPDDASECPRCGCPVDLDEYMMDNAIDKIKQKRSKRKVIIGLSIVVGVICVIVLVVLLIWNEYDDKRRISRILGDYQQEIDGVMDEYNKNMDSLMQQIEEDQREFEKQNGNKQ